MPINSKAHSSLASIADDIWGPTSRHPNPKIVTAFERYAANGLDINNDTNDCHLVIDNLPAVLAAQKATWHYFGK